MPIEIQEVGANKLSQYKKIPITFKVKSMFQVHLVNNGLRGIVLREKKVIPSYIYDPCDKDGPEGWPKRFDIRNWGIFLAFKGKRHVGGVTIAFKTPDVYMLEDRNDLAVLWDIRVHPDFRGCGIGTKLFNHAVKWSKKRECKQLKIETQNVNVPACYFYEAQGCQLGSINRYGYFGHPVSSHEVMLLWYLNLKNKRTS
jgi:GNAT superfamily N-acetyltransferase